MTVHRITRDRGARRADVQSFSATRTEYPGEREVFRWPGPSERELRTWQQSEYGGMKLGVAFFGWLTATGLTVILVALVGAITAGLGAGDQAVSGADRDDVAATSVVGVILLLVVLLVSYFCGGYVAGRMARFSGARQGVAVWLWGVIVTALLAVVGAIAGAQFDILSSLGTLPSISLSGGEAVGGVIALICVQAVALVGAMLGGRAGMRSHRQVDHSRSASTLDDASTVSGSRP